MTCFRSNNVFLKSSLSLCQTARKTVDVCGKSVFHAIFRFGCLFLFSVRRLSFLYFLLFTFLTSSATIHRSTLKTTSQWRGKRNTSQSFNCCCCCWLTVSGDSRLLPHSSSNIVTNLHTNHRICVNDNPFHSLLDKIFFPFLLYFRH